MHQHAPNDARQFFKVHYISRVGDTITAVRRQHDNIVYSTVHTDLSPPTSRVLLECTVLIT